MADIDPPALRYTGNWALDSRAVPPGSIDAFEAEWMREASRRYIEAEKIQRATGRRP
jgi:hypothetical protein